MAILKAGSTIGGVTIADTGVTDILEDLIKGDNGKGTGTVGHTHDGSNSLSIGQTGVRSITGAANITSADNGLLLLCSGTFTLSLASAASLGDGFHCTVLNISGVTTLDAAGSELLYTPGLAQSLTLDLPCTYGLDKACGFEVISNGALIYLIKPTIIPHGSLDYSTPGTFSWLCPVGVTSITAGGTGAGGGGGAGYATDGGGGGGGGAHSHDMLTVVPGTTYTLTIGAAGAAGTNKSLQAGTGGSTSFGALKTWAGGTGGYGQAVGGAAGGTAGGTGGSNGETGGSNNAGDGGDSEGAGGNGSTAQYGSVGADGLLGGGGGGGKGAYNGGIGGKGHLTITW